MNFKHELQLYEEYYNSKVNKDGILKCVDIFLNQGHTGLTATYSLAYIKALEEDHDNTVKILQDMKKENSNNKMQLEIISNIFSINQSFKDKNLNDEEKKIAISLMLFVPITPLTGEKDEWRDVSKPNSSYKEYQNKRYGYVFKHVFYNGIEIAFDLKDMICSSDGEISSSLTSGFPKKQIIFPYLPDNDKKITNIYRNNNNIYILNDKNTIAKLKNIKENEH